MKAFRKSVTLLFITLVTFLTAPVATAAPKVTYPVIGVALRNQQNQVEDQNFVGSEWIEMWSGEYITVTIPSLTNKGAMFHVSFRQMSGLPGFYEPVLNQFQVGLQISQTSEIGWYEYMDGSRETYGSTTIYGQNLYFYSWSWWSDVGWQWSTVVAWGTGSGIDNPGTELDRTHFGTIPGEPREYGFIVTELYLDANKKPILGIFYDSAAGFSLQSSGNLSQWLNTTSTLQEYPELTFYQGGVEFKTSLMFPVPASGQPTFGPKQFFRLKGVE